VARGFASVWLASVVTLSAFFALYGFGVLGNLSLGALVTVLVVAAVASELSRHLGGEHPGPGVVWVIVGVQIAATAVVIYAIGWGGTLAIGFVFVIARDIEEFGPRVWGPAMVWTVLALAGGETAIATGLVSTYVPQPAVHGLAVLGGFGVAYAVQLLAAKKSEQDRSDAELRASEADLRQLFAANPQPMWVFDATTLDFLEVNEAAVRHYGYSRPEFMARRVTDIRPSADAAALLAEEQSEDRSQRVSHGNGHHQLKDGRVISVEARNHEFVFEGRPSVLVAIEDVTERNALEAELEHQAFHDSLTNLANRALFSDRVQHALQRLARESSSVAVLLLDLDAFKTVNDSVGHTAGDELLITVSQRLRDVLRPSDTAARLGGDEFAILLEGLAGVDEAREITQRVMDTFETPFYIGGTEAAVRASIGVAVVSESRIDADALLRNADAAMYRAKSHGKGCYRVFEPSMHSEAVARLELEADLRHSIVDGEFILHYQPVVSLSAGQVVALEALVRWQHPRRGLLMPMEFIPLAEDNGLIVDLGHWVLTEACRQARTWQLAHPDLNLTIAVNVSPRQLAEPGLVDDVCQILTETGLSPHSLTLEITESILIADPEAAIARLTQLKNTGVRLAIDDFGIGYSSLGALKNLPVDELKIDKAFIDGVTTGTEADALVQAILRLAHTFNLLTVAEGVEHTYQLERLEELGCDQIQGFCFSHPIPAPAIDHLLAQQLQE